MPQVICIDASINPKGFKMAIEWHVKENESYLAFNEYTCPTTGKRCYQLMEDPNNSFGCSGWFVERFLPLSSIDETEFERNYNTQPS